jgi:uncharacterized protein (TIGR02444 family)
MDEQQQTPFWDFSLAVYGADGVQAECLDLQERCGIDVNLLLFAAYAGAKEGIALTKEDLAAAVEVVGHWHDDIVRRLRGARQALKAWAMGEDQLGLEAGALRQKVKANELEAERIEQFMLWNWLRERNASLARAERGDALPTNIQALLVMYDACPSGTMPQSVVPHLLRAAGGL